MANKLTTEEWKKVENATYSILHRVVLKVDGRKYTIILYPKFKQMQLAYQVYIDGEIKGEWLSKDSEIGKKYLCPKYHFIPSRKQYQEYVKTFGKRWCKTHDREPKKMLSMYIPEFDSFRTLKKVLIDNNESIEIISL